MMKARPRRSASPGLTTAPLVISCVGLALAILVAPVARADTTLSEYNPQLIVCWPSVANVSYYDTVPLQWYTINAIPPISISIDLYRAGAKIKTVANAIANDGSLDVRVRDLLTVSEANANPTDYSFKLSWDQLPSVANSSTSFAIRTQATERYRPFSIDEPSRGDLDTPFSVFWVGSRFQSLYLASEFGMTSAGDKTVLYSIGLRATTVPQFDVSNFRVDYKFIDEDSLLSFTNGSGTFMVQGLSNLVNVPVLSRTLISVNDTLFLSFAQPLEWSGQHNLVIEVSHRQNTSVDTQLSQTGGSFLVRPSGDAQRSLWDGADAPWKGKAYPYPRSTPTTFKDVMNAVFDRQLIKANTAPQCGSPPRYRGALAQENFQWKRLFGSSSGGTLNLVSDDCSRTDAPTCRIAHTAVSYGKYVVVFGGSARGFSANNVLLNDVWLFHLPQQRWVQLFASDCAVNGMPSCRQKHSAVVLKNRMYVFSGAGVGTVQEGNSLLWSLDLDVAVAYADSVVAGEQPAKPSLGAAWNQRNSAGKPFVRGLQNHVAVGDGNATMYIFGGSGFLTSVASNNEQFVNNQLFAYNTVTDTFRDLTDASWTDTSGRHSFLNTSLCVRVNGSATVNTAAPYCMQHHAGVYHNGTLLFFGGVESSSPTASTPLSNRVTRYDIASGKWSQLSARACNTSTSPFVPVCRVDAQVAVLHDRLVVMGGATSSSVTNDVWDLDLHAASHLWRRIDSGFGSSCHKSTASPACVKSHAMVRFGQSLYVFGGELIDAAISVFNNNVWAFRRTPLVDAPVSGDLVLINTDGTSQVTINGTNFGTNASRVTVAFGEQARFTGASQISSISNAQIQLTAPAGSGTNVSVSVTVLSQQNISWTSPAVRFASYAPPTVSTATFNASAAGTSGGAVITIAGTNLASQGLAVTVGGVACSNVTWQSQQRVDCTVAAGVGQNLPIVVTVGGQLASNTGATPTFSYTAPSIRGIAYQHASTLGGSTLEVYGLDFGPTAQLSSPSVTIGGVACATTTWRGAAPLAAQQQFGGGASLQWVTCSTRAGTGANHDVAISVAGRASATFTQQRYSYDAPRLLNVSYTPGRTEGGDLLDVWAINVGSAPAVTTRVQIGGQPCKQTIWLGPSSGAASSVHLQNPSANETVYLLRCEVPVGNGGNNTIDVTVDAQRSTFLLSDGSLAAYAYLPPSVLQVTPPIVNVKDTTTLTIEGLNFGADQSDISVNIGGRTCGDLLLQVPHTRIKCILPSMSDEAVVPVRVTVSGQSNADRTISALVVPIPSSLTGPVTASTSGAVSLAGLLLFAIVYRRREKVIRASSLIFSSLIVLGSIMTICAAFWTDNQREPGCSVAIWLVVMGFTTVFGSLVLKNYRILVLFRSKNIQKQIISDSKLLGMMTALWVLDALLLYGYTSWSDCGDPDTSLARLAFYVLILSKAAMLVCGIYIALRSRQIHIEEFQERVQLGWAIYTITFYIIVMLVVIFLFSDETNNQYLMRSYSLLVISFVILFIIFGPKFYTMIRGDEEEDDLSRQGTFRRQGTRSGNMRGTLTAQSSKVGLVYSGGSGGSGDGLSRQGTFASTSRQGTLTSGRRYNMAPRATSSKRLGSRYSEAGPNKSSKTSSPVIRGKVGPSSRTGSRRTSLKSAGDDVAASSSSNNLLNRNGSGLGGGGSSSSSNLRTDSGVSAEMVNMVELGRVDEEELARSRAATAIKKQQQRKQEKDSDESSDSDEEDVDDSRSDIADHSNPPPDLAAAPVPTQAPPVPPAGLRSASQVFEEDKDLPPPPAEQ